MRLALPYPEPEKGGRGKKGKASETKGFSGTRLKNARAVLAYSRELVLAERRYMTGSLAHGPTPRS
jgi:hypothetical protein